MSTVAPLTADGWWQAAADRQLLLSRCRVCSTTWLPWMPHCPECGLAGDPEVIESTGEGTLYSWVVVHYSMSQPDDAPFTVGSVLLDEGAMFYGRLTAEAAAAVRADLPLAARFVERDGRTVIDFGLR
jgi:uncharacterized OB-fold protein